MRKHFAWQGVAREMKIIPVLGALFPVLAAAQDLDDMFKGGKIEVPSVSANSAEGGLPMKPAGIFHPGAFADPGEADLRQPPSTFHLRVAEPKADRDLKMPVGEPRPGIEHKLRVKQIPAGDRTVP